MSTTKCSLALEDIGEKPDYFRVGLTIPIKSMKATASAVDTNRFVLYYRIHPTDPWRKYDSKTTFDEGDAS